MIIWFWFNSHSSRCNLE